MRVFLWRFLFRQNPDGAAAAGGDRRGDCFFLTRQRPRSTGKQHYSAASEDGRGVAAKFRLREQNARSFRRSSPSASRPGGRAGRRCNCRPSWRSAGWRRSPKPPPPTPCRFLPGDVPAHGPAGGRAGGAFGRPGPPARGLRGGGVFCGRAVGGGDRARAMGEGRVDLARGGHSFITLPKMDFGKDRSARRATRVCAGCNRSCTARITLRGRGNRLIFARRCAGNHFCQTRSH